MTDPILLASAIGTMTDPMLLASTCRLVIPNKYNLTHSLTIGGLWKSPLLLKQTFWFNTKIEEFPSAIPMNSSRATSFGWRNSDNIEMIPLCFLNQLYLFSFEGENQRWSRGHKARGQGQGQGHKKNPRPRPRPRTAFSRTEPLEAKDRNARGQGQGPRTQAQVFSEKKSSKIFFRRSPIH